MKLSSRQNLDISTHILSGFFFIIAVSASYSSRASAMLHSLGAEFEGPGKWIIKLTQFAAEFPGESILSLLVIVVIVRQIDKEYIEPAVERRPELRKRLIVSTVLVTFISFCLLVFAFYAPLVRMSKA